jgi:hypothetical protein
MNTIKAGLFAFSLLVAAQAVAGPKPVLVYFELTADETMQDHLPSLNAEISQVLEKCGRFQLVPQQALSEHLIMDPAENLAFCADDPGCIADLGSEVSARSILVGHVKPSFDGSKVLIHLKLIDVPDRSLALEKFGQYENTGLVASRAGELVRALFGLPAPKPKPKPEPKPIPVQVAKKNTPPAIGREAPPAPDSPWTKPWTLTAAGVGVAALATASALGSLSVDLEDEARQLAATGDPLSAEGRLDKADSYALGANALFGVGGAALAGAVVLLVLDLVDEPVQAVPKVACTGTGCAASISLRF